VSDGLDGPADEVAEEEFPTESLAGSVESVGSVSMNQSSFDVFKRTTDDVPEEAAAPEDEETPASQTGVEFANPLHVGSYGVASARVDLSADDESALSDYEHNQRGLRPGLALAMTFGVGLVTLIFGFFIGDIRNARRMINAQIESSSRLQDGMADLLIQYDQLKPIIAASREDSVDWSKTSAIPKELPRIDGGVLTYSPVPLDKELARLLANFVVDLDAFFQASSDHRRATLGRDKAELEGLEKGSEFAKYQEFLIVYDSTKTRCLPKCDPPRAKIVAKTGVPKLNAKKTDILFPTTNRAGVTTEKSARDILFINKEEFALSSGGNALTLYSNRVKKLKERLKAIQQYEDGFRNVLKEQATRTRVFSF
jgi:hypothetical protein